MSPIYLLCLLAASACMVLVDRRWRLFFWRDARRATWVLAIGVALLLVADVVGIALGVFSRAPTWAMTGIVLGPELPLEEPLFLAFLTYLTMNLVAIFERLPRRERAR
ncbi:MAG TPA: lycopene cyclase domain-containing protein [Protaetiibacter sp.]|jgi:lycopene cyclase domain-containing protein|nr:lycopene cyclase domain-containing protein [Protaetiibacter sp.]